MKKRILILVLALLLVLPGGSTYRRVTWHDWFYNLPFRQWYWPLQLSRYDPGFGTFIWSDRRDVYRHEGTVLFSRWGLAMDSTGRVLAYDPSVFDAFFDRPEVIRSYGITDTPPLLDPAVLDLDFSTADMIDLEAYGRLTRMSHVGSISFIFEFSLTDGRMLVIHADRLPEAEQSQSPDPWRYFSLTHVEVLDFFSETRNVLYQRSDDWHHSYTHISAAPDGYGTCDRLRRDKWELLAQEAVHAEENAP